MSRLTKILLLSLITFMFISCKKEPKMHKIKYQITFLEIPHWASSNSLEVGAVPCYSGEYNNSVGENGVPIAPVITYNMTKDGLWEYEYWKLQEGDEIYFHLFAQLDYHFELRIFIDGIEVSYKKIKISDSNYFEIIDLDESGLDDTKGDGDIKFTYYE